MKQEKIHISSGGIIYKIFPNKEIRILLLYRKRTNSWHLPKGTKENKESLEKTALREVTEETGYKVEKEKYLGKLPSFKEDKTPKITHYYLMKPVKRLANHDKEHDRLEWVGIEKAKKLLSQFRKFEKEEEIVEVAEKILKRYL